MLFRLALEGLKMATDCIVLLIPTRKCLVILGDLPEVLVLSLWLSNSDLVLLKPNEMAALAL